MDVQNNVNFQGSVPRSEKRRNTRWAIIGAPVVTAGSIALEALDKNMRKDTFTATAKECTGAFAKDFKVLFSGAVKYILRNDKLADKIFKLPNTDKRIVAAAFILDSALMAGILKLASDLSSKFRHRND